MHLIHHVHKDPYVECTWYKQRKISSGIYFKSVIEKNIKHYLSTPETVFARAMFNTRGQYSFDREPLSLGGNSSSEAHSSLNFSSSILTPKALKISTKYFPTTLILFMSPPNLLFNCAKTSAIQTFTSQPAAIIFLTLMAFTTPYMHKVDKTTRTSITLLCRKYTTTASNINHQFTTKYQYLLGTCPHKNINSHTIKPFISKKTTYPSRSKNISPYHHN